MTPEPPLTAAPSYRMIGGDGKHYGPVSPDQIRRWIADKRAGAATLLQPLGSLEWLPIGSLPEFHSCFPELQPGAAETQTLPPDASANVRPPAPPFTVGGCLSGARALLNQNFLAIIGACITVWVVTMALNFIPLVGGIIFLFLTGPLHGALFRMVLDRRRGQSTTFLEAWTSLQSQLLPLVLAGALIAILTSIGLCLLVLPGLYLMVVWVFSLLAILDRGVDGWEGLQMSRRMVSYALGKVAVLLAIVFLPLLIAHSYGFFHTIFEAVRIFGNGPFTMDNFRALAQKIAPIALLIEVVGLLVMPMATCVIVEAYERLLGSSENSGQ